MFTTILKDNMVKPHLHNITQAYIELILDFDKGFFICFFLKLIIIIKVLLK